MLATFTSLIPILAAASRNEEEYVTELRMLPEGWWAVGGLALIFGLCWAVVWMYRHEGRIGVTPRMRITLAVIRCVVLLTLAAIFLEPVRVRILRRVIDSYTIVLIDDSSSMGLTDSYTDEKAASRVRKALGDDELSTITRSAVVDHLLGSEDRKFLTDLAARNRVKLYRFGSEPELLATMRALRERNNANTKAEDKGQSASVLGRVEDLTLDLKSTGSTTNIERAVRRSVDSVGGAPTAAVVLLSDGGFNEGGSIDEVASFAKSRGLPIHVVGVGDPSVPRNVRIVEVLAPENAFKQDPFAITARLATEGIDGETLRVELREHVADEPGDGKIVADKPVLVSGDSASQEVSFERRPSRIGRYVYTVQVTPLPNESITEDNSRRVTVNVVDSRTRVLIVSGSPSWEYRYVSRLLERDETFDVSCWLQSADLSAVRDGNTVIDHLPLLPEELFEYDVVILMNPDKSEFDVQWSELIDTWVTDHGGGLLVTASRSLTPAFLREPAVGPIVDLLPIVVDVEADLVLNQIGHYQLKSSPLLIPDEAYSHPILQMGADRTATKLAWLGLGEVYWHYPVQRAKPAATVLMQDGDPRMQNSYGPHVLAAVQFVGGGRSGFLGFDGTWRWRKYGEQLFDRFWVQFIRYLAEGKLLGGKRRGTLLTDRDEYGLGDVVTVSARLLDERFEPIKRDRFTAYYEIDGESTAFALLTQRDRPSWYEGRFVPDRIGAYRVRVEVPTAAGDPVELGREVLVSRPNIEMLKPQMDRVALANLAQQSSGGRFFEVDELDDIPAIIPDLHEEIPIRSRPTSLWDNGLVLTFLIMLLTVEWIGRKWSRLL